MGFESDGGIGDPEPSRSEWDDPFQGAAGGTPAPSSGGGDGGSGEEGFGEEGGWGDIAAVDLSRLYGRSDALMGLSAKGANPWPIELEGLGLIDQSRNLDDIKKAYQDYFGSIATPNLVNALAATGSGRSGAQAEAISLGGASIGQELAKLANERLYQAGLARLGIGSQLFNRQFLPMQASGQLELGGANILNNWNMAQLGFDQAMMLGLLNMLSPFQTGQTGQSHTYGWDVKGNVGVGGAPGGGGTGLPTS